MEDFRIDVKGFWTAGEVSELAERLLGVAVECTTEDGVVVVHPRPRALTTVERARLADVLAKEERPSAAEVQAAVADGATLVIHRGDTWTATLTGLGNISGREKLWFTIKSSPFQTDAEALVQIEETDGLIRLNGAAATAAWGDIAVNDAVSGDVTITLTAAATAQLTPASNLVYDVQMKVADDTITTLTQSTASVVADVTRATS